MLRTIERQNTHGLVTCAVTPCTCFLFKCIFGFCVRVCDFMLRWSQRGFSAKLRSPKNIYCTNTPRHGEATLLRNGAKLATNRASLNTIYKPLPNLRWCAACWSGCAARTVAARILRANVVCGVKPPDSVERGALWRLAHMWGVC